MPLYEYRCPEGHVTELVRKMDDRNQPAECRVCNGPAERIVSINYVSPDGIYSYAPNIGDPERFERQREAIKNGQKVIPRQPTKADRERWGNE